MNFFSSQECDLFAKAVEASWAHLATTCPVEDVGLVKAALGRAVLKAAGQGERDPSLLVAYALAHLEHAKAEVRHYLPAATGHLPELKSRPGTGLPTDRLGGEGCAL